MAQVLSHEMQFIAEVVQAVCEDVQFGGAASGAVSAAPLGGSFEHLVQPGHRAGVVRECLVEQVGELLRSCGGKTVVPVDVWCDGGRTCGRCGGFLVDSVVCSRYG
ncbi:hypothetical protein [Streptomyces sp. LN549]|uniref:hypothetical protein n=1 Tax=Streptomyces sp. LN549 TaxID=3112979 RepID=UPI0037144247